MTVTYAFGDAGAELYGVARLGVDGSHLLLFAGGAPVVARQVDLEEPGLRFDDGQGHRLDLRFDAVGPPADLGDGGTEQLCRVHGTVGDRRIDCLGQRGEVAEEPDWGRIEAARAIAIWLDEDQAVTLAALRPRGAHHHAEEAMAAAVLGPDGAVAVQDPRLSTTYDGEGRQRRAGLELWVRPDDPVPQRAAGEAVCGSSLALGRLRLECAFFRWHVDGREGVGRYDVVHAGPSR